MIHNKITKEQESEFYKIGNTVCVKFIYNRDGIWTETTYEYWIKELNERRTECYKSEGSKTS